MNSEQRDAERPPAKQPNALRIGLIVAVALMSVWVIALFVSSDDGPAVVLPTGTPSTTSTTAGSEPPLTAGVTSTTQLQLGRIAVTIPDNAIGVTPDDDVGRMVANGSPGAVFRFAAGTYRGLELEPKDGMTFIADPGVILNGSNEIGGFESTDGGWVSLGHSGTRGVEAGTEWSRCDDGYDGCIYPEDLFIDGTRLWRVTSLDAVESGTWFFDLENGSVHIADDPTGRTLELGAVRWAFHGESDNVTIAGFTIRQYATPGRQAAINPRVGRIGGPGKFWVIANNTIVDNHAWGVKIEDGMELIGNVIERNGLGGVGGVGDDVLIEGNRINENCVAGYRCFGFEGGGIKVDAIGLAIRENEVSDNLGHGIHTDCNSVGVFIEGNLVEGNQGAGIHHEISGTATVRGNTVTNNGFRPDGGREPGIIILSSFDVQVYDNIVRDNANAIIVRQDDRVEFGKADRIIVRNNTVRFGSGAGAGLVATDDAAADPFAADIEWLDNIYEDPDVGSFRWNGDNIEFDAWQAAGNDA